jgi:hypothetical protein
MKINKQSRTSKERRLAQREPCSTAVAYATQNLTNIEYIQDISAWGVFIRTKKPIPVGADITMTIPPQTGSNSYIKIIGEVVRANAKGIGVKFKMGIDDSVIRPLLDKK